MLWLSGAIRTELLVRKGIGFMYTPQIGNRVNLTGVPWAADTGCFSTAGSRAFDLDAYFAWLEKMAPYRDTCLFATAPDVVGDAAATWERSKDVLPRIRWAGYPAALVAQDGLEHLSVEWDAFDCLFVGGTTAWKLSEAVVVIVAEAKRRGKWVHIGRVNSLRRLRACQLMGADSADGTFVKFGPDQNIPKVLGWFAEMERQPVMEFIA